MYAYSDSDLRIARTDVIDPPGLRRSADRHSQRHPLLLENSARAAAQGRIDILAFSPTHPFARVWPNPAARFFPITM